MKQVSESIEFFLRTSPPNDSVISDSLQELIFSGTLYQQMADAAFDAARWSEAWRFYISALKTGDAVVDIAHCLLFAGRCALYFGKKDIALSLLGSYVDAFPYDAEGLFYLGRVFEANHREFEALNSFNAAALIGGGRPKYQAAVAKAAHSLAFQGFGFVDEATPGTYVAVAKAAIRAALDKDADHFDSLVEQMALQLDVGDLDGALSTFEQISGKEEKHGRDRVGLAATNLALALARGGYIDKISDIAFLDTYTAGRRIMQRCKSFLAASSATTSPTPHRVLIKNRATGRWEIELLGAGKVAWPKRREHAANPAETVSVDCAAVFAIHRGSRGEIAALAGRIEALNRHFAGIATLAANSVPGQLEDATTTNLVIRKSAWNELVERNPSAGWDELRAAAFRDLRLLTIPQTSVLVGMEWRRPGLKKRPRVVVLSRHGPRMVGGGEQFLRIAAETYVSEHDARVFFAGLSSSWEEAQSEWPVAEGISRGFVYNDADAFREFCLRNAVDAVHVISGLGEFVLDAVAGLNVRLIYGVHFWNEFIPSRVLSRPFYPNVSIEDAKPLPMMQELIARSDFTYVNSDFCSDIAHKGYNWAPPIIYSVPVDNGNDVSDTSVLHWPRNFILLVNARADKGWGLFLDVAERLADQSFVAIAGQSDRGAALADVHRRGLHNVTVLDRTDRIDEIYRAASIVVVPSFSFVETFSRVVVEAGRLGKPVLMADSGNLSYLGAETDLVLPKHPDAWAARITELTSDTTAYQAAVTQIRKLAAKYSPDALRASLKRIPVRADGPRVLVCAGSGIGNICHVTPLIKKLSDTIGAPVDVLVAGDFAGSFATMEGSQFVGQLFEKFEHVAMRSYDVVLITHSFGTVIPHFNAYRVLSSRDFMYFDPAGEEHEADFNLRFLTAATGIEVAPGDSSNYFFGSQSAAQVSPPTGRRPRIGLHAGSKGGIWLTKRWPGFARLARELGAAGVDVWSVGTKDEYIEGTVDKTGLTIARMGEELGTCDAVISNDSGVMNIANAIGIPLVAIFGPTNPVTRGPRKSECRVLTPSTDCAPCEGSKTHRMRFSEGNCRCISLIDVQQVIDALVDLGLDLGAISQEFIRSGRRYVPHGLHSQ